MIKTLPETVRLDPVSTKRRSVRQRHEPVFVSRTRMYCGLPDDFGLDGSPYSADGLAVSEQEYWDNYYAVSDYHYEWNNGLLEEKPVSDFLTFQSYKWLFLLMDAFLITNPIAKMVALETAFRLEFGNSKSIRKPDLFVVRNDNPVPYRDKDRSFKGIADLCVEAISDSTKKEAERDTKTKYKEYMMAGVREYYMIDANVQHMKFVQLNAQGNYELMPIASDRILRSQVLPGFQFRLVDLYNRPTVIKMATDPVYRHFVLPQYVDLLQQIEEEKRHVEEAKQRAEREKQRADKLAAKMRSLGIHEEDL